MPTQSQSLTQLLLASSPAAFTAATRAPFLTHAGQGTLPKQILEKWLGQDRLYAQAYIRFAALLLANIPFPMRVDAAHTNERLVDCIIDAITNVRRELKFFEDVAARYALDLEVPEVGAGVTMYRRLFNEVGEGVERGERGILDGLVLLWGTEKVYLEAWRYAGSLHPAAGRAGGGGAAATAADADGGALRAEFIPNWSSEEFGDFVDKIAAFVDGIWAADGDFIYRSEAWLGRDTRGVELEEHLKAVWEQVLDVEQSFWPNYE